MDDTLVKFLEQLDTELCRQLLADLRDPEKRDSKLYSAINKTLDRHKFQINKLQPEGDVLGALSDSLADYKASLSDSVWN